MRNMICIVCPIGCPLEIKEDKTNDLLITGNQCLRGAAYAREEILSPKRTVTAACRINGETSYAKRVPVKNVSPCPKGKIPDLLNDIYKAEVVLPVKAGDIIISNWNGEGIDVVVTRTINS